MLRGEAEEEVKEEEEEKRRKKEDREKDDRVGKRGSGTTGIFPAGLLSRRRHNRRYRRRPGTRPLSTRGTTVNLGLATAMFPIRTRPASRTRPFPRSLETRCQGPLRERLRFLSFALRFPRAP